MIGDEVKLIIQLAIFISDTELICPLVQEVFENHNIKLHITNNYYSFTQVNTTNTGGGVSFTV